jgi:hypothetical protein
MSNFWEGSYNSDIARAIMTGEMTTLVDDVTGMPTAKFVKLAEGDLATQGAALLAAKAKLADDRQALRRANAELDGDRAALLAEKADLEREKRALRVGGMAVLDADEKGVYASLLELKADLEADRADLDRDRAALDMNRAALEADRAALVADRAKLAEEEKTLLKAWLGFDWETAELAGKSDEELAEHEKQIEEVRGIMKAGCGT